MEKRQWHYPFDQIVIQEWPILKFPTLIQYLQQPAASFPAKLICVLDPPKYDKILTRNFQINKPYKLFNITL